MILSGSPTGVTAALDGAIFMPAANYSGSASLQMNTSDNDGNRQLDEVTIDVTPFNDPPMNTVPSGVTTATEDVPQAFNIPVNDIDVANSEMVVTLTSSNETTITLPSITGLTFDFGDGTTDTTLKFRGSLPNVNAALNGVVITPRLNYIGSSTLVITSEDQGATGLGKPGSDTDSITINWSPVNDAPVNTVPGPQAIVEETSLVFSAANGNALSVNDVDATTALVQVTLDAQGGTLTLGSTTGLSFSANDGSNDATTTFSGTLTQLNAALANTTFTPNTNFAGAAKLTVTTSDLGNSGAGGAKQDTDAVTINVAGVNDAPVNALPGRSRPTRTCRARSPPRTATRSPSPTSTRRRCR